jgi:hypothetical protein
MPYSGRTGQGGCGGTLEKQKISIADAVSLVYEIESTAASCHDEMMSTGAN